MNSIVNKEKCIEGELVDDEGINQARIDAMYRVQIVDLFPDTKIMESKMNEIMEQLENAPQRSEINVKVIMLVVFGVLFLLHPIAIYDIDVAFEKMFYMLAAFLATFTPIAILSIKLI